jgi:hypothetical protein
MVSYSISYRENDFAFLASPVQTGTRFTTKLSDQTKFASYMRLVTEVQWCALFLILQRAKVHVELVITF